VDYEIVNLYKDQVINEILNLIVCVKNPIERVDDYAARYNVEAETRKLVDVTQLPALVYTTRKWYN